MQAVRNSSRGTSLLYSSSAALPSTTQGVRPTRASIGPTATLRPDSDRQITTQSSRGQLFTPVASDDPVESNEHVSQQYSDREIQSDPEDFGDSFDEEDEEIIELTKRIEKSAQTEKSPPSRARKLNIRDTHEHDDYGGALLSEEERKLLGTSFTLWLRLHVLTLARRYKSSARCAQTNRTRQIPSAYHGPFISLRGLQHQCTAYLLSCWRSSERRMPSCAQQPKLGSRALCTSHQLVART